MMRVFLSSTVFDLIDVRAELGQYLRDIGIIPVLSDDKLSDFFVQQEVNSIETCLTNVASCDEIVVILDRRYGPRLGRFGFDDVSATHLEYRRAIECKLPIHFFVRDRLDADFAVWKRNGRKNDVELAWIDKKDSGLFELIEEQSKLSDSPRSNWYFTFSNSLDLKAAINKHFGAKLLPRRLVEAIQGNNFPIFDIQADCNEEMAGGFPVLNFSNRLVNVGGAPAFNYRVRWEHADGSRQEKSIVAPGQSILMSIVCNTQIARKSHIHYLIAEYESPLGIAVRDRYQIRGSIERDALLSGGTLVERKYNRTDEVSLEIDGD